MILAAVVTPTVSPAAVLSVMAVAETVTVFLIAMAGDTVVDVVIESLSPILR